MGRAAVLLLGVLVGCSDARSTPPPRPPAPAFAIHEWGLIAVPRGGETLSAVAMSGAPRPFFPNVPFDPTMDELFFMAGTGLKPVIYVHVDEDAELELSVRVGAPNGKMLEVLPASAPGPESEARWNRLRASGTSCRSTVPAGGPPCRAEDHYCEALEDPFYDTTDATCLHVRTGGTRNHLFYRARVDAGRLPFSVARREDGTLLLHNASRHVIAGPAFRIIQAEDLSVHVSQFDPPAPGADVAIALPPSGDIPGTRAAIIAAIRRRGLSDEEARAFDRAWAHLLLDVPIPPEIERLALGEPPEALLASRDVVLYLLPDELAESILPLGVAPRPNAVHRALFVRMDAEAPRRATVVDRVPGIDPALRPRLHQVRETYTVELGRLRAQGSLTGDQVGRVVRMHLNELAYCASGSQFQAPSTDLTIRIIIAPPGHVAAADMARQPGLSDELSSCLTTAARRWTFPAAQAPSTFTQAFRLEVHVRE